MTKYTPASGTVAIGNNKLKRKADEMSAVIKKGEKPSITVIPNKRPRPGLKMLHVTHGKMDG